MSHNHHHHSDTKNISLAFFLNLAFAIIEIVGGILTNSVAILSDALHDFGDSLSLGFAWYFQKISNKKRDKSFSYGYKRFSVLGAIINSIILAMGSVFILSQAIPRLIYPQQANATGMFFLAILGIAVNGFAMLRLRKGKSLNEKTVSLHLLEDVLGWVAVLVGSIIMLFADAPIIDPIISILIALFIIFNIYKNLKSSLKIFLQGVPEGVDLKEIQHIVSSVKNVEDVHDVHAWSIDGLYNIVTLHIVHPNNLSIDGIKNTKNEVKKRLHKLDVHHITIECESVDEKCELENC